MYAVYWLGLLWHAGPQDVLFMTAATTGGRHIKMLLCSKQSKLLSYDNLERKYKKPATATVGYLAFPGCQQHHVPALEVWPYRTRT
jgi:hypothetical protein